MTLSQLIRFVLVIILTMTIFGYTTILGNHSVYYGEGLLGISWVLALLILLGY